MSKEKKNKMKNRTKTEIKDREQEMTTEKKLFDEIIKPPRKKQQVQGIKRKSSKQGRFEKYDFLNQTQEAQKIYLCTNYK